MDTDQETSIEHAFDQFRQGLYGDETDSPPKEVCRGGGGGRKKKKKKRKPWEVDGCGRCAIRAIIHQCLKYGDSIDFGDGCVFDCNPHLINVAGEQCVHECNKVEKQLINVAGDSCVNECSDGQFISLLGDRCLELCPVGAHPNATSSEQCECSVGQFISFNGDKCLIECPHYSEDHDLDHHCDG